MRLKSDLVDSLWGLCGGFVTRKIKKSEINRKFREIMK